ncbi:zinc finger domain-containing protein [Streptomyces bacillaris]|uniref:zinc finger domain-containing protein n=1 Tax=Streptomyces bacillaris TaxID=68179 RepID=UPI00346144D1
MRTTRFPQLTVRCSWCEAPAGELCTNPATGVVWRSKTHDVRRTTWVIHTTTCPACAAAPGSNCFTTPVAVRIPLATPHPERITEADTTHTATHRTQPWPHQPPTAPTATARSGGPAPKPAATWPSIPTQTRPGTPRSGATSTASSGPAARPPTSP